MFQLEGIEPLIESLNNSAGETEIATTNWIVDMAMWIKSDMQNRVPVVTGNLKNSIQYHLSKTATGGEATFSSVWYGKMLDEGKSEGWDIYARGGKPMHFQMGGNEFFAWHVKHPPVAARNWSLESLKESGPEADKQAEQIGEWILGRIIPR